MNLFRHPSSHTSSYSANPEPLRCTTPVTFSKELFGSLDAHRNTSSATQYSIQTSPRTIHTVNPASLSPEMRPSDQSNNTSSDMTQHPAVSVGRASLESIFGQHQPYFGSSVSSTYSSIPHSDIDYISNHTSFDAGMPLIEDGLNPSSDNFNTEYDPMACYNPSYPEFDISEYLTHEENSRHVPEIRTSDTFGDKTLGLQSPIGASSFGCDSGSNAVSV